MKKILLMMIIVLVLAAAACKDKAITWTAVEDSTFGESNIYAVAYGNGKFVAAGYGGAMAYSTDGAHWTAATDSSAWDYTDASGGDTYTDTANIYSIAYGNKRFVAVGQRGKIAYSDDGATWTAAADSAFPATYASGDWELSYGIFAIAYGGGKWVAGGGYGTMAYSTDGVTWTAAADSAFGGSDIYAIAYGGGRFVAVGSDGTMAYSKDGANWTAAADSAIWEYDVTYEGETTETDTLQVAIYAVAYGAGRFVAVGYYGAMAYSQDGATWTAVTDSAFSGSAINAIAYGGGRFVAVGRDGKTAYSKDGATWTAAADSAAWEFTDILILGSGSITTADIIAVAYGNKRFAAVGAGGAMAYADWK
jgi:hypothetical protein